MMTYSTRTTFRGRAHPPREEPREVDGHQESEDHQSQDDDQRSVEEEISYETSWSDLVDVASEILLFETRYRSFEVGPSVEHSSSILSSSCWNRFQLKSNGYVYHVALVGLLIGS